MSKVGGIVEGATSGIRIPDLRFTKALATTAVAESSPNVTPASGPIRKRRSRVGGSIELCKLGFRVRKMVDGRRVALGTYPTIAEAEDVLYGRQAPRPVLSPAERFWSMVDRGEGCWLWKGQTSNGYGRFALVGRVSRNAQRAAWELTNGPIPGRLCVLHRCDNRRCVRPDHLFLGTHSDNALDMYAKGRSGHQRRRVAHV